MQYGIVLANLGVSGDPRLLVELAREAEDAGWDGVFIWDSVFSPTWHSVYKDRPDLQAVSDPWIALAAIAVQTERIRIGTMVTPIARRRPWKLARETVTLDHLSKGRLILPVALGAVDDGAFSNVGEETDRKLRAQRLDEGLEILAGLWSGRPYSFQGMAEEGLRLLAEAREKTGLAVVTEVMEAQDIELICEYADILQIGARNVQNFALLKKIGQTDKPILLKRGMMTTITEFLMSAEYILSEGNPNVILCERGIRTFETSTRNTLDLSAVPVLREKTHLPIIVDPSHGTGYWQYVAPMSYAAIAAGADGLLIEVHPHPEDAMSDGGQSLKPDKFAELMKNLAAFAQAAGRKI